MNAYISDQLAREQTERLLADAVVARRVRRAREARRARRGSSASVDAAGQTTGRPARRTRPRSAAAAHFVARPFSAFHSWLAAGYL